MNPYEMLKKSVSGRIVRGMIPLLSSPNGVSLMMPRIIKLFLLLNVIFLFAAQRAGAQQNSLVGTWQGFYDGISTQMVLEGDGQFSAIQTGFDYNLWMVGYWAVMPGQNVIAFKLSNYEPKSSTVHPAEIWGGTFQFTSPYSFIFRGFAGPTLEYRRIK